MIILEDTRNQIGKHKNIAEYCKANGIEIVRTKLVAGDYTLPTNQSILIDTKKDIQELIIDVTRDHERFKRELTLAKKCGAELIVLTEDEKVQKIDDLFGWYNWRLKKNPKATKGSTLAKMLYTIEKNTTDYSVKFEFCKKSDTGKKIIEILGGEK